MATQFAHALRTSPVAHAVRNVPVSPAKGATGFRSLFSNRPTESLSAGEAVFWEGDDADYLYEIVSGCVRLCKALPDGRRAITGFTFAGEILGVSSRDRYLFTAEAVGEVRLRRYSRTQMHDSLARMPGLNRDLLALACDELCAAQNQMLLLGRKTACERIASFLLDVASRTSKDAGTREIDLPMTRLDIADFLGLTIETVSRVFGKLKTEGVIALPSAHHVKIVDVLALRCDSGEVEGLQVERSARMSSRAH